MACAAHGRERNDYVRACMEAYIVDWLNLLVRWLHLITGIAWIGASFYFVMLDNSLSPPKKPDDAKRGVFGELWAVHGGGFYNSQKYLTGPKGEPLSENLHWSKWEAYTTWLSGWVCSESSIGTARARISSTLASMRCRRPSPWPSASLSSPAAGSSMTPCAGPRGQREPARRRDAGAGDGRRLGAVPPLWRPAPPSFTSAR